MPYITQARRDAMANYTCDGERPITAGELNYTITKLIIEYITHEGLSYQVINDIVGALEGAKLEFYRRIAVPYEDEKREANGDVYL